MIIIIIDKHPDYEINRAELQLLNQIKPTKLNLLRFFFLYFYNFTTEGYRRYRK